MLIAQLTLQDIAEISRSRKGKARADAPLSDEELALQDDRRAALALSDGGELPPPSNAQRLAEDPAFLQLTEAVAGTEPEGTAGDTDATRNTAESSDVIPTPTQCSLSEMANRVPWRRSALRKPSFRPERNKGLNARAAVILYAPPISRYLRPRLL
ncbi:hypothetical protein LshimejAT787_1602280 [Lyophyllum shimeji]|uniref:Uncharacterized protein n=1 Tax=Lyophyllum shimeji TaxID=47721 RepID=A0A9P3PZA7_LYOSH|nr:hypothetical protein LshimejAT787_1602280 [Lyophyllum shimeji]